MPQAKLTLLLFASFTMMLSKTNKYEMHKSSTPKKFLAELVLLGSLGSKTSDKKEKKFRQDSHCQKLFVYFFILRGTVVG